jgi:hypothetical protein
MAISFDGTAKRIILSTGTTAMSAAELYSRWKDWVATGAGAGYLPAFAVVGGDPLGGGVSITPYFFLQNGWKVQPQAASHTLIIDGNLLTADGSNPIAFPAGAYQISVVRQLALKSETVSTGGTVSPTQQQIRDALALTTSEAPASGSIDDKLQKIKADTSLVPALI